MPPSHKSSVPLPLARRLLFPNAATTPRLLSDAPQELNDELYDFLALALRAFVLPWWSKLTKYDKEFLPEIARVVTHAVRALEPRARRADVSGLVLRDVPALLAQHYADFHAARLRLGTSYAAGEGTLAEAFHSLQPHIALTPEGAIRDEYLRQAVERVLQLLLPPQDWNAQAEREIVREIFVKVLIGDVFPRIVQPWFIQKMVLEVLGPPRTALLPRPRPSSPVSSHALLVLFLSAVQGISTACLAAIAVFQRAYHGVAAIHAASKPVTDPARQGISRPIVDLVGEVLTMRARFASAMVLAFLQMCMIVLSPWVDRYAPHVIEEQLCNPNLLLKIVQQGKKLLFPNGWPGPPPVDPTPEEQVVIRESLEIRLAGLLPDAVAPVLIGPDMPARRLTIKSAIDPLTSVACNNHLLILVLDALLLMLFPEMGCDASS
ncbi:hypothetical protein EXIGLDRAFT_637874, partial [Exidia glandulosa HHB12029]